MGLPAASIAAILERPVALPLMPTAVDRFATYHGIDQVNADRGKGEFLGSWNTRAEGLREYRRTIRAYEAQRPDRPRYRPPGGYRLHRDAWATEHSLTLKREQRDARTDWLPCYEDWEQGKLDSRAPDLGPRRADERLALD